MTIETNRVSLLVHYAQKPVSQFYQLDGFYMQDGGDDIMCADSDGDCLMSGHTAELMASLPEVRILIPLGTPREHVARLLAKLAAWAQENADQFESGSVTAAADGATKDLQLALEQLRDLERRRACDHAELPF